MGIYRYLLAICVAASHCGFTVAGYNQGVAAVISFFLLSGFVMTRLIERHYSRLDRVYLFYVDRLARLLPQFIVYSLVVLALLNFTKLGQRSNAWMDFATCSPGVVAFNFSLFGNNFHRLFDKCMLLPASWSLGQEAFFYMTIPMIILVLSGRGRGITALGSLSVFLLAYAGTIDSELFGYRFLPGTLFIFLVGAAIARPSLFPRGISLAIWVFSCVLFAGALTSPETYGRIPIKEVLVGIIIGVPAVGLLAALPFSKLDELFGSLSYGVFLNHLLVRWVLEVFAGANVSNSRVFLLLVLLSTMLAWITFCLVEQPVLTWRRKLRVKASTPVRRYTAEGIPADMLER